MNLAIEEKVIKRALHNIEYVCQQLFRFAKMSPDEHIALLQKHPKDAFYQIPHPNGNGHIYCGPLAWKKIGELADLSLELEYGLGRRVGRQRARDAVTNAFVTRVLQEARDVNQETAALLLRDALEALRKTLVVTEHYLPCVLFPDDVPDQFSVGPVIFTQRAKFFKDKKNIFKRSIEAETAAHIEYVNAAISQGFSRAKAHNTVESRQLIRDLQARAINTYRGYQWIASIKVTDCDKSTSQERAFRAVEIALHILRIILGAEPTRKIRLAWSRSDVLHTAHLYADANGVIHSSLGMKSMEPVGIKNWHNALIKADLELNVLGSALVPIVDPVESSHLHQRLIDAVNWFGDAVTDPNLSSSIVKYVSAIERLFFGKFEQGRTKMFANRIRDVLLEFGCDNDHRVYEQALTVYKTRSTLVHGEQFLTEDEAYERVHLASALSRMCILCSAQLYPLMLQAFDNPGSAQLEETMKRISSEGLDWLVEARGFGK